MWRRLFSVLLIASVIVDHERTHLIIIIFFFIIHHHNHWLFISHHSPSPLSYRCCQSNKKHCTSTHFNHLWNKENVSFLGLGRKYNSIQTLQPKYNNMHDFTILYLTLRLSNIWSNKQSERIPRSSSCILDLPETLKLVPNNFALSTRNLCTNSSCTFQPACLTYTTSKQKHNFWSLLLVPGRWPSHKLYAYTKGMSNPSDIDFLTHSQQQHPISLAISLKKQHLNEK